MPSCPDDHPSPKADGGRDKPVFIDAFRRNLVVCKALMGLGLAGSLGIEVWCMVMSFVKVYHKHGGSQHLGRFILWEKIANIAGVVLLVSGVLEYEATCRGLMVQLSAVVLYLVGLGKHPVYNRQTGQFRDVALHKFLTEINFMILLTALVIHYLPPTLHTYLTRFAPPSPYSPSWTPWVRSGIEGFTLIVIGCMRRTPRLHYQPMKMGTGFGMNSEPTSSKRSQKKEDANVMDRAGCTILEFVFLIYVGRTVIFRVHF